MSDKEIRAQIAIAVLRCIESGTVQSHNAQQMCQSMFDFVLVDRVKDKTA